MYLVLAAAVGFAIGMAAHDLAIQSLRDKPLRPFIGVCRECGMDRGWVSLRCSNCGREVGREGLLALVTAAVGAGMAHAVGPSWSLIPYAGFLLLTAALGITDIEAMRIVDRLNLRGSVLIILLLGITSVADENFGEYVRGLEGGAAYFAGAVVLFLIVRGNGFGAGDVKLAPLLGVFTAYLGWTVLGQSLLIMAGFGGLVALFALLVLSADRRTELPYGPAMIIGAWAAILLFGIGT